MEGDFNMKVMGSIFVLAGILTLLYGGLSYGRQETMMNMGSFHGAATAQHTVPVAPIVGGLALVGGLVLLLVPRRQQD